MTEGMIFDIKRYAIHDGPGIRVTVFLKGCPLRCWWCHNPEGLRPEPEEMASAREGAVSRTVGRRISAAELISQVEKDRVFFEESGGGVTFSGGEPLMQPAFLTSVLYECKRRNLHTALDTCGHCAQDTFETFIGNVDLWLYDLKLMDAEEHKAYTGLPNDLILANLHRLDEAGANVIIRLPLVPSITDTGENMRAISGFVTSLASIDRVDLLPYHRTADGKYDRLKLENRMRGKPSLDVEATLAVKGMLEEGGLKVKVGG